MPLLDPFDLTKAPMGEPLCIAVGTTAQWRRDVDIDGDLFTLEYQMRRYDPSEAGDSEDLTAQVIPLLHIDGSTWASDILPADTTAWATGRFFWDLVVTRVADARTKIVDNGWFDIFGSDEDRRSHAQIMVAKINSILERRADDDVEAYSIKSRSITKMSPSDLRAWRDYYIREMEAQQSSAANIFRAKRPNASTLRVRFKG